MDNGEAELKTGELGYWTAVAISFGMVTSSTTLFVAGRGVSQIGSGMIISMVIAFALMSFAALGLAELSTMFPVAGSFMTYVKRSFGSSAGVATGLVYWLVFIALASEATIVGQILNFVFPGLLSWQVWGTLLVILFVGINIAGIDLVGKTAVVLLSALVGVIVILSLLQIGGFGQTSFETSELSWTAGGWTPILAFVPLAVWLLVGWEVLGPLAEEVEDAQNVLPKAMLTVLGLVFLVRVPFIIAMDGSLASATLAESPFPQVVAFEAFFGPVGKWIMAIISFVATGATFNAVLAGTSRQLWNLGREGYLPSAIGRINPRFQTPDVALVVTGGIILALLWLVSVPTVLINAAANFFIVVYIMILASVIALRYKLPDYDRPFSAGGPESVPAVTVIGIVGLIAALYFSGDSVFVTTLAVVVATAVVSVVLTQLKARREAGTTLQTRGEPEAED
ncbi:APC family permease [Natrinema sp. 74]|uniref:APC family permease n=1 Tax=Natrinema sp. 74 TaxID=3384159 RepID=UPI0038D3B05E